MFFNIIFVLCVSPKLSVMQIRIAVKLNPLGELAVVCAEAQNVLWISGSDTRRHSGRITQELVEL